MYRLDEIDQKCLLGIGLSRVYGRFNKKKSFGFSYIHCKNGKFLKLWTFNV